VSIKLYFDEDSMSHAVVHGLRARGVDVMTALEVDLLEHADEEHLSFAASERRALYSFNIGSFNIGDFQALHTTWLQESKSHAGIVLARQRAFGVGEQVRRLLKLLAQLTPERCKTDWSSLAVGANHSARLPVRTAGSRCHQIAAAQR
jgi:Domain of unknown function (DUF5615)